MAPFKLILIDRDGVINVDRATSVKSIDDLELIESSLLAIAQLNQIGCKVALVTNQAVVGRGELYEADLNAIHNHLQNELAKYNGHIDKIFVCTDVDVLPNNRRKPAPGMLIEAMDAFNITPDQTLMVGDDLRDLQAAQAAGCARALVKTGKGLATLTNPLFGYIDYCYIFQDLAHCVLTLLHNHESKS